MKIVNFLGYPSELHRLWWYIMTRPMDVFWSKSQLIHSDSLERTTRAT